MLGKPDIGARHVESAVTSPLHMHPQIRRPSIGRTRPDQALHDIAPVTQTAGDPVRSGSRDCLELAREHARDENYDFMGPIGIAFEVDPRMRVGSFSVTARLREGDGGAGAGSLVLPNGERFVLGETIEAAVRQPWDWLLLGERGREEKSDFVGMTGFGASGPAPALYKEFGITADNVVARVKAML